MTTTRAYAVHSLHKGIRPILDEIFVDEETSTDIRDSHGWRLIKMRRRQILAKKVEQPKVSKPEILCTQCKRKIEKLSLKTRSQ